MKKQALIVWGGWAGHQPEAVSEILSEALTVNGFVTHVHDSLHSFADTSLMAKMDLIVPVWTMGKLTPEQQKGICGAVRNGAGIAGCHGGMCDSFRDAAEYQFMTGGQWVAHPGNSDVIYTVRIVDQGNEITAGIADYTVHSEQYYLHTDPSNHVLAVTKFPSPGFDGPHVPNGEFDMPVAWTRYYGKGKVFYHSVGHNAEVVSQSETLTMITRGMVWAAR